MKLAVTRDCTGRQHQQVQKKEQTNLRRVSLHGSFNLPRGITRGMNGHQTHRLLLNSLFYSTAKSGSLCDQAKNFTG